MAFFDAWDKTSSAVVKLLLGVQKCTKIRTNYYTTTTTTTKILILHPLPHSLGATLFCAREFILIFS